MIGRRLYEDQGREESRDPETPAVPEGKLYTQPYDLAINTLMDQLYDRTMHIRQISGRPEFQRWYVWNDRMASRLIESMMLNIPIPPCYLAQDPEYKLDVIDGQQRIYSVYRFLENQFPLQQLSVLTELHGKRYYELPTFLQRRIGTYTMRCIVITNDSDHDIKFEVFERLNSNTMPLNAQELRNCISRGALVDLLGDLAAYPSWLRILNRTAPDKRMRDEELILRFFGFYIGGVERYRTPQKLWLNDVADKGKYYPESEIRRLEQVWMGTVDKCLQIFEPWECFRRLPADRKGVVNRALMDLTMYSLVNVPHESVKDSKREFYRRCETILQNDEFDGLITRGIDHATRTKRRFEIWDEQVTKGLF